MNLSVNQNRQFFVANAVDTSLDTLGDVAWAVEGTTSNPGKHIFMKQVGKGGIVRSDLINVDNIISANVLAPTTTTVPYKRIKLDSDVNSGAPFVGQTYVLSLYLNNFVGSGDANTYVKHGVVVAKSNSPSNFYFEMAKSIASNFKRDLNPFVKVYLTTEATATNVTTITVSNEVTPDAALSTFNDTYTSILLVGQDLGKDAYIMGVYPHEVTTFEVSGNTVEDSNHIAYSWLDVENNPVDGTTTPVYSGLTSVVKTISNVHTVMDMEYFCMGERGDQNRTWGHLPVNPTQYMVDPSATGYYIINIHYYFEDNNEGSQKSEKTLTIVADSKTKINAVLGAHGTAAATLNNQYKVATGVSANLITPLS